jgi:nucleoporin GLE1
MGSHGRELWGRQWDKMLEVVYEGATKAMIGGKTPEGVAARVRVQLEVERIMKG